MNADGNWRQPPDVLNFTCWGGGYEVQEAMKMHPTVGDIVRVVISLIFGLLVVISNCIFLFALNHKGHAKHLPVKVSYNYISFKIYDALVSSLRFRH